MGSLHIRVGQKKLFFLRCKWPIDFLWPNDAKVTHKKFQIILLTFDPPSLTFNKVRREKLKAVLNLETPRKNVTGIYFDGRKDRTRQQIVSAAGSFSYTTVREEHYVLISEPGSSYLDHVTPSSRKATDIAKSIIDSLPENGIDLKALRLRNLCLTIIC